MSGKMSRNKGANAEREIIKLMQPIVDAVMGDDSFELKRNLFQTREGGADIAGFPEKYDFFSIEIKRQEALNINNWWEQTLAQCEGKQMPILIYKQSRKPWKVIMYGSLPGGARKGYRSEIAIDDFLDWFARFLYTRKDIYND